MRPQEIIKKKRDGAALTRAEIGAFVDGVKNQLWADYQIAALLMAMFLRGLDTEETGFLIDSMLGSGEILDFSDLEKPKADKHSTGGVGDKTSLIVAPLAAACGVAVPMISGRGLGHTGGTLDKLESINNYNVNLTLAEFKKIVCKCGFAMSGQTAEIAPADKKLYALRDATATVEYIPLIVASIMSKKLAEGLDALVLDVKTGAGAFMKSEQDAVKLAAAMCAVGARRGVRTEALISDMNQPLGEFVGNALEVYESIKILRSEQNETMSATRELSIELAARILILSGICNNLTAARKKCEDNLRSGAALEKFRENIELQKGDARVCDKPEKMLEANVRQIEIRSAANGFVFAVDTKAVGEAISMIGGGRTKTSDKIDFAVGFAARKKIGDTAEKNETLGILYCRNRNQADAVREKLQKAYKIANEPPPKTVLIKQIIN
jgi:pyrimidine-nucleoside phosphorylase